MDDKKQQPSVTNVQPWKHIFWPTLAFFMGFAGLSIYGPLVPKFVHFMHLSPLRAGILASVPNLSGSLLRLPFGAWTDPIGFKRPFQILLILALLGIIGVIWVIGTQYPLHLHHLFGLLLLLGVLVGAGIATFPVGIAQISRLTTNMNQGLFLAFYAGIGNMAPGLFALLLPYAFAHEGPVRSYLLWALGLMIVLILYTLKSPKLPNRREMSSLQSCRFALGTQGTWPLTFLYFLSFGGFLALVAWLPEFYSATYHVSLILAGFFTLMFTAITSLIRIAGGWLADQFSAKKVIFGALIIIAIAAAIVSTSSAFPWALGGIGLMGMGMGIQNGAVFKMVPLLIPDAVGGASGIIGGLGALGGFFIPPALALIGGSQHNSSGFIVFMILAVMGLGVHRFLHPSSPSVPSANIGNTSLVESVEWKWDGE